MWLSKIENRPVIHSQNHLNLILNYVHDQIKLVNGQKMCLLLKLDEPVANLIKPLWL